MALVVIDPRSNKLDNYHRHRARSNLRNIPPPGERPFKRPRLASKCFMDPLLSSSGSTSSHRPSWQHSRTTSANSTVDRQGQPDSQIGDTLRRGHSEDVLSSGSKPKSSASTEATSADLMEMLRQSPSGRQDPLNRAQLAASRAAIMASDRRKRLSEHSEEQSRRRSSSALSFGPPGSSRSRQSFTQLGNERPLFGPSSTSESPSTQRFIERPLPQRPSPDNLHNRRSRDITLPRWEPDAGVSKCPICGTNFSFWYRKHHCRKCGRVVCANCSPHRITIPRQFIVHPPEDATPSPSASNNAGVEVVDLTSDDDTPRERANAEERPQSSEYRIDPALGGGQEVRLCNPCVPDPNPLPHLPYLSTSRHTFDSFPRPDNTSLNQQLPPIPGFSSSRDVHPPTLNRRISSGRSDNRSNTAYRFDCMAPHAGVPPPTASSPTNRRHSHASRPVGPAMPLPGYSSLYGSAPDQIAHEVSHQNRTGDLNRHKLTSQSAISHQSFKTVRIIVTMYHWALRHHHPISVLYLTWIWQIRDPFRGLSCEKKTNAPSATRLCHLRVPMVPKVSVKLM